MTPEHAKRLIHALEDNIEKYEAMHGKIKDLAQCSRLYSALQDTFDLLLTEKKDSTEKLAICNSEKKKCEEEIVKSNNKLNKKPFINYR